MAVLNWAIIGPGTIARDFAAAFSEVEDNLYAVGSRTLAKAQQFATTFDIDHAYGNYDDLLRDPAIDVVYISTPHSNHYDYIKQALEQGKHVLCEKAITMNSTQLEELVSLAEAKNLILSEAMTIYHMPLYQQLRKMIQEGKIGAIKMIQVSFGSCKEADSSNRFFNKDLAGGALLDIGTYALSFARYFLSSAPNEVLTTMKSYETGVDEQSGIILRNDHDEMAVVNLTFRAKMPKRGIVGGEKGFITIEEFPRADRAVVTYTEDGSTEIVEVGDTTQALRYEIEQTTDLIKGNKSNQHLVLSRDVMEIMTNIRNQWGLDYPFE